MVLGAALTLLLAPTRGTAQEMGQGQAHITTRADVRLSLESVPGTSAARLAALGRAASGGMGAVRACYDTVVAARPTVTGRLRLSLALGATGAPAVEVVEDGPGDAELTRCVRDALRGLPYGDVERPAAAVLVFELANTAARGVAESSARADEAGRVEVAVEEGRPVARDGAPGLRFVVRGEPGADGELAAEAIRVVRSQIPAMLDCRRRAGRRGMDPSGVVELRMRMRPGTAPELESVRSTVRDARAPECLEGALERAQRLPTSGPASLEVTIELLAGD
jgi:hypothetical protein